MPAFISHSFENKPEFDNIADALTLKAVPFWNPSEVKSGSSLRDQLRSAVKNCEVCIFIATRPAVESSWCGAELGAFWGAGKPILVYLAESSLKEDDLPPIVQGDVWERRIVNIAERTKEIINQSATPAGTLRSSIVGSMTVEQLEKLILGAFSLAAASGKAGNPPTTFDEVGRAARGVAGSLLEGVRVTESMESGRGQNWHNKILWVDDRPDNNLYERQAFEAMGFEFTLARSTDEALRILSTEQFATIISDMGRKEGPREGYVLLEALREKDPVTPFFIYAGSNALHHKREAGMRGAQGCTNIARELLDMVVRELPKNSRQ